MRNGVSSTAARPDIAASVAPALLRDDSRPPRVRMGDHDVRVGPLTYTADDLKLLLE